jgi:hypothetical protein
MSRNESVKKTIAALKFVNLPLMDFVDWYISEVLKK